MLLLLYTAKYCVFILCKCIIHLRQVQLRETSIYYVINLMLTLFMQIELQEEKSMCKIARRNEEKLKREIERLQALIKK